MLLDTHVLIWTMNGEPGQMGPQAIRLLKNSTDLKVSAASILEVRLKQRRGKLLQIDVDELLKQLLVAEVEVLDITAGQAKLPDVVSDVAHTDPFDLLLMAQAYSLHVSLLTCDEKIIAARVLGLQILDARL